MTIDPIVGTVRRGHGVGRTLGFPTANLDVRPDGLQYGIYAAWVERANDSNRLPALAYWGERPVFDGREPSFELYLIDAADELVGETLTVTLVERLRPDQAFASVEALKSQMHADVAAARRRLVKSSSN